MKTKQVLNYPSGVNNSVSSLAQLTENLKLFWYWYNEKAARLRPVKKLATLRPMLKLNIAAQLYWVPHGILRVFFRGYHSRCTWTAPTEIEFRCRTMIGVSAYLKVEYKKKILIFFFPEKKSFLPTPKNVTFSAFKLQVAVFLSFLQLCPNFF
jgi:hypothetical protein